MRRDCEETYAYRHYSPTLRREARLRRVLPRPTDLSRRVVPFFPTCSQQPHMWQCRKEVDDDSSDTLVSRRAFRPNCRCRLMTRSSCDADARMHASRRYVALRIAGSVSFFGGMTLCVSFLSKRPTMYWRDGSVHCEKGPDGPNSNHATATVQVGFRIPFLAISGRYKDCRHDTAKYFKPDSAVITSSQNIKTQTLLRFDRCSCSSKKASRVRVHCHYAAGEQSKLVKQGE